MRAVAPVPERELAAHLVRFSGELRQVGVPVGLRDEIDAAAALRFVDVSDPEEVRLALRSALKIPRRWWDAFDRLFDESWRRAALSRPDRARNARPPPRRWRGGKNGETPLARIRRELDEPVGQDEEEAPDGGDGGRPGASPRALLRTKVFDECTPDDLRGMERLLERLARRIATRPSRRMVPSGRRGPVVDVRRSLRRSLAHGGEPIELAHRTRAVELPGLVVLCDTSGSMDACSRFLIAFVLALRKVMRRTEIFAFNTALTRLTPWLGTGDAVGTLERLARRVEDWSGGTRIGECLLAFVDRHLRHVVRGDTTVLILSDGLDRGDAAALETALLAIRRRARRIVWLNPLMGDPRYRPETKGMRAALPHVDRLVPAHNLEALEAVLPMLER